MTKYFRFAIEAFCGFAPQLLTIEDWLAWKKNNSPLVLQGDFILTHLPLSLKRRTSDGVKLALDIAFKCLSQNNLSETIDYAVFASQHGESSRLQTLLQQIERKEMLSPTGFSQSVHNTASGLFSLTKKLTGNINSIAAGKDTFFMAFIEALTYLHLHPNARVMVVIYDEALPMCYKSDERQYDQQYACAFVLRNCSDQQNTSISCKLELTNSEAGAQLDHPPALSFLAWLYDATDNNLVVNSAFWQFSWYKADPLN